MYNVTVALSFDRAFFFIEPFGGYPGSQEGDIHIQRGSIMGRSYSFVGSWKFCIGYITLEWLLKEWKVMSWISYDTYNFYKSELSISSGSHPCRDPLHYVSLTEDLWLRYKFHTFVLKLITRFSTL